MLTFRPLGALLFGLLSDKYGRKYPLMANILIFSGLQLASGFAPNFLTYSITRVIFGMAMGGEWGLGAALAMEVLPLESRGYLFIYFILKLKIQINEVVNYRFLSAGY